MSDEECSSPSRIKGGDLRPDQKIDETGNLPPSLLQTPTFEDEGRKTLRVRILRGRTMG